MKARLLILLLFSTTMFGSGCTDEAVVSPELASEGTTAESSGTVLASSSNSDATPFTFRAPLDPFRINQPPDFMMHSRTRADIVIQRSVFLPGPGPWHTHPGPSFVYVEQGEIKLDRFNEKEGCTETEVFGPGDAYFEVANEVHRAVVVSTENAVLHVTRFNIPEGGPIAIPADDPGC